MTRFIIPQKKMAKYVFTVVLKTDEGMASTRLVVGRQTVLPVRNLKGYQYFGSLSYCNSLQGDWYEFVIS